MVMPNLRHHAEMRRISDLLDLTNDHPTPHPGCELCEEIIRLRHKLDEADEARAKAQIATLLGGGYSLTAVATRMDMPIAKVRMLYGKPLPRKNNGGRHHSADAAKRRVRVKGMMALGYRQVDIAAIEGVNVNTIRADCRILGIHKETRGRKRKGHDGDER